MVCVVCVCVVYYYQISELKEKLTLKDHLYEMVGKTANVYTHIIQRIRIFTAFNSFAGAVKSYKFTRVYFLFELVVVVRLCAIVIVICPTQQCCSLPKYLFSNSLSMKVSLVLLRSVNMYM